MTRVWRVQDFAVPKQELGRELTLFMQDFSHALHTRHGFPYSKAGMATVELASYLNWQRELSNGRHKTRLPATAREPGAWLIPLALTIEDRMMQLLNSFELRVYRPASLWETIPFYLQFLKENALLNQPRFLDATSQLRAIHPELVSVLMERTVDPRLVQSVMGCWDDFPGGSDAPRAFSPGGS